MSGARIWIRFADNGNIRKWSFEPFDEGTEFVTAATLAHAGEQEAIPVEVDVVTAIRRAFEDVCGPGLSPTSFDIREVLPAIRSALVAEPAPRPTKQARKFVIGQRVTKIKGASWTGKIVGFYSTKLTPVGYCVKSENGPRVQLYSEAALAAQEAGRG